jgi:hypothetical protein
MVIFVKLCSGPGIDAHTLRSGLGYQQYTQKIYNLNYEHKHTEMPNKLEQRKIKLAIES